MTGDEWSCSSSPRWTRSVLSSWDSPEYVPVKKLREGAAALDIWAVEGLPKRRARRKRAVRDDAL